MADISKRVPGDDCEGAGEGGERGERGKRGHRGHRGHDGHDGATGATGATGPAGSASAAAIGLAVVFRPGDPLGSRQNVFVTWAETYAALQAVAGLGIVYLEFDDQFVSPCVIPAGTWDMTDVTWICSTSDIGEESTFVNLADGASIVVNSARPSMRMIGYGLTVTSSRVGPVAPFFGIDLVLDGADTRIFTI